MSENEKELPSLDFSTFVLSLSTSAMVHLGDAPAPEGDASNEGDRETNLQMARQVIDILGMLQEKTAGHLTEDEAALLEQMLYDLRIRFVKAAG